MFWRRRKDLTVEEAGWIRKTLQELVVPELGAIKEKLSGHDEKFVSIDRRFDQVDQRFDQVDQRFEQVDQRFDRVERRLDAIEADLSLVRKDLHQMAVVQEKILARIEVMDFERRLVRLEALMEAQAGKKSA